MDTSAINRIHTLYTSSKERGGTIIPESDLKNLLQQYGIPVPVSAVAKTPEDAARAAEKTGYPVVCKVLSNRMLHKSDEGGVRLNIENSQELTEAFTTIQQAFSPRDDAGYLGVLVEAQASAGIEIIAGLQYDDTFGPVLMLGMGGTMANLLDDVIFAMLPVDKNHVRRMLQSLKGWKLLAGFRGSEPIDIDGLVSAIHGITRFGIDAAPFYQSVDFNPIIARPDGVTVADAKMIPSETVRENAVSGEMPRTDYMEQFFNPASVAVIGASAGEGKIGNVIMDSLVNHQFKGKVYPINPNREELMGVPCYPDLDSLPETPELVVVVVDLNRMPDIMDNMHRLGIHNALIVSGGGKELGGERADLEKEISRKSREYNIRLIGPNCIGSYDGNSRFDSFFHSHERLLRPPSGNMGFLTQSGTWGCAFLEEARIAGVSRMVSYGNRVDVDEGDLVAHMVEDPATTVISSYIEGLGDGRKFLHACDQALNAGKPVIVFKTGRTSQSAKASVSHTGAYGGSYRVYEGVFNQHDIILTDSFHELYAASETLATQPVPAGKRVAMVSNGAGPMVNAMDHFQEKGLELATLARNSVASMKEHFSFFYIVENPVDVTGSATAADYQYVINTLMEDENVDIIMPFFVFQDTPLDESIVERLEKLNGLKKKPILCCAVGGPYTLKMSDAIRRTGVPVYPDVAQWVAAASAMADWGEIRRKNVK
ncbi:MAG: acetate--CoA ligase family protein [Spirochaetota bacterium]